MEIKKDWLVGGHICVYGSKRGFIRGFICVTSNLSTNTLLVRNVLSPMYTMCLYQRDAFVHGVPFRKREVYAFWYHTICSNMSVLF